MFEVNDQKESTNFEKNVKTLLDDMPKEAKMILRRMGSKAKTLVAKRARQTIKKKSGKYQKSFKRGKVWDAGGGNYRTRIYNSAPHAHLIEDGHRIVGKDGSEHGFKQGYKVLDKGMREFDKQFESLLEKEIDRLLDKL